MESRKSLQLSRRFESPRDFLAHTHWLMSILGVVIEPLLLTLLKRQAYIVVGTAIAEPFTAHHHLSSLRINQEFGSLLVEARLHQNVQHHPVPADGAPQHYRLLQWTFSVPVVLPSAIAPSLQYLKK